MSLSFAEVALWDPAPLDAAVDSLGKAVDQLDRRQGALAPAPPTWDGHAAAGASHARRELTRRLTELSEQLRAARSALSTAEAGVRDVAQRVRTVRDTARLQEFAIGPGGDVSDVMAPPTGLDAHERQEYHDGRVRARDALVTQMGDVVRAAEAVDKDLGSALGRAVDGLPYNARQVALQHSAKGPYKDVDLAKDAQQLKEAFDKGKEITEGVGTLASAGRLHRTEGKLAKATSALAALEERRALRRARLDRLFFGLGRFLPTPVYDFRIDAKARAISGLRLSGAERQVELFKDFRGAEQAASDAAKAWGVDAKLLKDEPGLIEKLPGVGRFVAKYGHLAKGPLAAVSIGTGAKDVYDAFHDGGEAMDNRVAQGIGGVADVAGGVATIAVVTGLAAGPLAPAIIAGAGIVSAGAFIYQHRDEIAQAWHETSRNVGDLFAGRPNAISDAVSGGARTAGDLAGAVADDVKDKVSGAVDIGKKVWNGLFH